MADASTILIRVFENFAKIVPRRTINEWEGGFVMFRGKIKKSKHKEYKYKIPDSNARWIWPFVRRIEKNIRLRRSYIDGGKVVGVIGHDSYWLWPLAQRVEEWTRTRKVVVKEELVENLTARPKWFAPFFGGIEIGTISDRWENPETQDLTTKDKHAISLKASVCYRINDMAAYYRNLYEHRKSILNLVEAAIADEVAHYAFNELCERRLKIGREQKSELEKSLLNRIGKRARDYGIEIKEVGFTRFVNVRTYRLIGNDPREISDEE